MNSKDKLKVFLENLEKGKYLILKEQLKDVMIDKCSYRVAMQVAKQLGVETNEQ